MPDDPLILLAAVDPASGAVLEPAARRALHERIVARAGQPGRAAPRRHRPQRVVLAAGLVAVCAATSLAFAFGVLGGQTPEQVTHDYARVIKSIPLPPGYHWPGFPLPHEDQVIFGGHRAAQIYAGFQALCAWEDAWLRAADARARASALTGWRRTLPMVPVHQPGALEDEGGMDPSTVAYVHSLAQAMAAGRPAPIRHDLSINCTVRRD